MRLGFITGLAAEARLLRDLPVKIGVGGGSPEGAARVAMALAAEVDGLVSFGLAGGLDPDLPAGTLLVPRQIGADGHLYDCHPDLLARLGGATCDLLLAGTSVAATLEAKANLYRTTKASAVDLESGAVAATATARQLPFAVLRAVADPASRALPAAAFIALDPRGRIALLRIAVCLLGNPAQLPQLFALARDAAAARRALATRLRESSGGFAP